MSYLPAVLPNCVQQLCVCGVCSGIWLVSLHSRVLGLGFVVCGLSYKFGSV